MAIYDKMVNIKGKQYGVFSMEYYTKNMEILKDDYHCAVEVEKDGESIILPIQPADSVNKPGICSTDGKISIITYPDEDQMKEYKPEGDDILVFSDHLSLQSLSDASFKFKNNINKLMENDGGESYKAPLLETDTAAMRAMKESINAKNIDLDKYKDRFGVNFPNDKRKLKDDNITLNMITRMCENLDIKLDLVFSDKDSSVPNPMNKIIKANIIPGDGTCTIINVDNNDDVDEEEEEIIIPLDWNDQEDE